MNVRRTKYILLFLMILAVFVLWTQIMAQAADKPATVYTLQVASHKDVQSAEQEFAALKQKVSREHLDFMRIERIGKYYSLRIGKFDNRDGAEQLFNIIKSDIPSAVVMDAYFIEKRIVKLIQPVEDAPHPEDHHEAVEKPDQLAAADQTDVSPDQKVETGAVSPADEETVDQKIEAIAMLVQERNFDQALEKVRAAYREEPTHPELNAWYGAVLLKKNQPAEARQYLEHAVNLAPDVADFHSSLGYCLFFLDAPGSATKEFQKAVSLDARHVDALAGLGIIYGKRGDRDKALEILAALKDLNADAADRILRLINQN